MHKKVVMRAVNLYNEFAWAQEILMRETSYLIVVV